MPVNLDKISTKFIKIFRNLPILNLYLCVHMRLPIPEMTSKPYREHTNNFYCFLFSDNVLAASIKQNKYLMPTRITKMR